MRRRICVITGTRAEFGLLYWLMMEIKNDPELELQILATGMHLSPEFGLTYKAIVNAGFTISRKIEILLSSDTSVGISKSMGLGLISFSEAIHDLQPDLVVVLGDRFEILAASIAASIARIPIAHIHGGERTEGAIDEAFRHSITKMSYLHFTATEEYRKRVIQLGETPDRVFNTGAPGLDNIQNLKFLSKPELEESLQFKFGKKNLLVTFHPVSLERETAESQCQQLLLALDKLEDTRIIFTMPNSDTDGRIIIQLVQKYAKENGVKAAAYVSLGQLRYLSTLQYVDMVIGNSSSGLIEVPSFKIPTINIGDRQLGRIMAESVIQCEPNYEDILAAIAKGYSKEFKAQLAKTINPYGEGGTSRKIKKILKQFDLKEGLKKSFYDLPDIPKQVLS